MTGPGNGAMLKPLRTLFEGGVAAGASDAELLDRFRERGPGAESAFSALVNRHGSMVLAVCRRLAGDRSSADDAFQATWLALVRRSGSIRVRGSLAPWLFAVARRIALRARRRSARLVPAGPVAPEPIDPASPDVLAERADLIRVVFEEIGRLPERYRAPVVLCHVERRSHDQAALDLGWPVGTVRGRLSRARRLLRDRLERRGVGLSVAVVIDALRREATAAIPSALHAAVLRFAAVSSAGAIVSGVVPASVVALQHGALHVVPLSIGMTALAGSLAMGIIWGGIGLPVQNIEPQDKPADVNPVATAKPPGNRAEGGTKKPAEGALEPIPDREVVLSLMQRLGEQDAIINKLREQIDQLIVNLNARGGAGDGLMNTPIFIDPDPALVIDSGQEETALLRQQLDQQETQIAGLRAQIDEERRDRAREFLELLQWLRKVQGERRSEPAADVMPEIIERVLAHDHGASAVPSEVDPLRGDVPGPGPAENPAEQPAGQPAAGEGESPVSGTETPATEPVHPGVVVVDSLLDPTIEEVERLFAAKAFEAVEIEASLNAWERLQQVDRGDGEPTEVDRFVDRTRKAIEARLSAFAGEPGAAPEALGRLRSDLKRLLDLHIALVGPEGRSAEVLGTRSVKEFASSLPREAVVEGGMGFQKPNDQRVWSFAQRVQSLFAQFDVELGTPVNFNGKWGFGQMGGMGGMMGGGMF